jgi:hypothetical protein
LPAVTSGLALFVDAGQASSYSGGSAWRDISGNNRNGTLQNSPTYSSEVGGALAFNGTTQHATFGDLGFNSLTAMTMQMFVKVNANSGGYSGLAGSTFGGGMDYATGFNWDQGPTSTLAFNQLGYEGAFHPGWVNSKNSSTPFGTWVNVAITATSATGTLTYTNGASDGSMATGTATMGTQTFTLATRPYNAGVTGLNGSIGQAMFYTRVLSQAEIQSNFNKFKARYGL